jgi:hypothetical protein
MATYDIESSETGKVYEVQVPDNTNPQDVQTYVAGVEQESLEREKQGLPPNRYHTPPEASIDHLVNNPEYSAIPSHDIYKDHLVNNRDYSSIPPTAWEKFKFGIAASTTDVENLSTILISEYPILGHRLTFADGRWGTQVLSPEEQWGEDFYRLSPGLRKDRIHQV